MLCRIRAAVWESFTRVTPCAPKFVGYYTARGLASKHPGRAPTRVSARQPRVAAPHLIAEWPKDGGLSLQWKDALVDRKLGEARCPSSRRYSRRGGRGLAVRNRFELGGFHRLDRRPESGCAENPA